MSALFQFFLFLLTLNNLALLGMGRLRTLINLVTAQGILLGGLLLIHDHALLAVAVLLIKGGLLPWLLHRTRRQIGADPHIKPRLGFGLAVLTGLACLVFSLWLEGRLPMTPGLFPPLLLPAGLTTLFCGLLLVVGRATALSQVMGYLVAENGIFLLGIPLMTAGAVWFELTLLLDIFVAVFVMGIAMSAAACYMTPIATPSNTLVLRPGNYTFGDYVRYGFFWQVLSFVLAVLIIPSVWPFMP